LIRSQSFGLRDVRTSENSPCTFCPFKRIVSRPRSIPWRTSAACSSREAVTPFSGA
jgi:hypothetical protein